MTLILRGEVAMESSFIITKEFMRVNGKMTNVQVMAMKYL